MKTSLGAATECVVLCTCVVRVCMQWHTVCHDNRVVVAAVAAADGGTEADDDSVEVTSGRDHAAAAAAAAGPMRPRPWWR